MDLVFHVWHPYPFPTRPVANHSQLNFFMYNTTQFLVEHCGKFNSEFIVTSYTKITVAIRLISQQKCYNDKAFWITPPFSCHSVCFLEPAANIYDLLDAVWNKRKLYMVIKYCIWQYKDARCDILPPLLPTCQILCLQKQPIVFSFVLIVLPVGKRSWIAATNVSLAGENNICFTSPFFILILTIINTFEEEQN